MAVRFQLVIDCADPAPLAGFWTAALGYVLEPPPEGFATWDDYWRDVGVPEAELGIGADCIIDPAGGGPRIWFQVVPEPKTVKNRLHLDIHVGGGRRSRSRPAGSESTPGPGGCLILVPRGPRLERRGPRSLRGGDEGPRGQRVRHQLTAASRQP